MTDHPMSCYPGQFAAWVPEQRVWSPDKFEIAVARLNGHLYGLEHYEKVANRAINRAMSGQITSSTGDNNAR